MIKPLITMGHPTLRKKAKVIADDEFNSKELLQLVSDLKETMKKANGIGIAAPQINISKQVCIVSLPDESPRYELGDSAKSEYVVINPEIKVLDKALTEGLWEGCLSVPGIRGFVKRPKRVQVIFQDETGKKHKLLLKDMLAVVFQHEIDHLFGKLFVDRVTDNKLLSFEENLS